MPTTVTGVTLYTITATNSGGSTSVDLSIRTNDAAPAGLVYATNPATYFKGTSITPNVPSNSGGTITSYAVTPALPAGLALAPTTGMISGIPVNITPAASYTVTGTNTTGSTTVAVVITVNDVPPTGLRYSSNPAVYTKGQAIAPNIPSSTGGAIASFSVSPALPAGLALNPASGAISGTPTALAPQAMYVVTGTGITGGSTPVNLSITVKDVPPSITYGSGGFTFTTGVAIVPLSPMNTGGPVVTWMLSPALPTGLSFSTTNGIISGTPTTIAAEAGHTITAINSGGSSSVMPLIKVNPPAPTIIGGPSSLTVFRGQTATFSVTAAGTGTLSYQWWKNGASISGATSSTYITPATVLADNAATFKVVVSDTYGGSATTSNAILTVKSGFTSTGPLNIARSGHTATVLQNGKVLIAGGINSSQGYQSTCELYDPVMGTFTLTGSMHVPRVGHTAVLLPNGKIYITGGYGDINNTALSTGELYDPALGTFSTTGDMNFARVHHSSKLLSNGKILIVGGYTSPGTLYGELYDPASETCAITGHISFDRVFNTLTTLTNGKILVVGGQTAFLPIADLYDQISGSFSGSGLLNVARSYFLTSTLLTNGEVLITGGLDVTNSSVSSCEIYNPSTGFFTLISPMIIARFSHAATRLSNGKVLILGGKNENFASSDSIPNVEIYDPNNGSFTATQSMVSARAQFTISILNDGAILLVGGSHSGWSIINCEIYK
jgi:hypothetical protein